MRNEETVAIFDKRSLIYSGPTLYQYSLRVYIACLSALKDVPLSVGGRPVMRTSKVLTIKSLIEDYMRLKYSSETHVCVRDSLLSLAKGSLWLATSSDLLPLPQLLNVSFFEPGFTGAHGSHSTPLNYATRAPEKLLARDVVALSAPVELAELFRHHTFSRFDPKHLALGSLKSWLYVFYKSQSAVAELPVAYLYKMSGYKSADTPDERETFRKNLNTALNAMQKKGTLTYTKIPGDRGTPAMIRVKMPHMREIVHAEAVPQAEDSVAA